MDLAVASPQVLIREALCALIAGFRGHRVAISVTSVFDQIEAVQKLRPDAVLSGASGGCDLTQVRRLRNLLPHSKVLLLVDSADKEFEVRAIEAGAWGCLSLNSKPQALESALMSLQRGEYWMSRSAASRMVGRALAAKKPEEPGLEGLTRREWTMLALVAEGYSNKEIASKIDISEHTVKTHLASVYRKLRIGNRVAAALYYHQRTQQAAVHEAQPDARSVSVPAA